MKKVSNITDTNYDPQTITLLHSPVAIPCPYPILHNDTDYDRDIDSNNNSDSEDKNYVTEKQYYLIGSN